MVVTVEQVAARLRKIAAERTARARLRADALRSRLPDAKQLLTDGYGARRVVLFGSLARGDFDERSDVDLGVEGLASTDYFPALADLGGLFDAPVDLVELERASASMLARIELEGTEL